MTNPYAVSACLAGHPEAPSLAADLTRWHDRMVAHLRRHGASSPSDCCPDDDCPRMDAPDLWSAARRVFGQHATHLTFLRGQADGGVS